MTIIARESGPLGSLTKLVCLTLPAIFEATAQWHSGNSEWFSFFCLFFYHL